MDVEEVCESDIWYQHDDMSHMKQNAVLISKEAIRYGFGSLLRNTYGKPCPATQDALNTWSRNGDSRRGLERWINGEYAARKAVIIRRTIQSVLRAQDKMRKENRTEPDLIVDILSSLSSAFSRDSKNFSRAMGIADELAILNLGGDQTRLRPELVPRTKSPRKSPKGIFFIVVELIIKKGKRKQGEKEKEKDAPVFWHRFSLTRTRGAR